MVALVLDGLVGFPAGLSPTSFHLSPRLGACGPVPGWLVSHFLAFVSHFFPKQFTVRGSQFFLKTCPPFVSLLVSAHFHWPCNISIHPSPRSVTAGVRPFPGLSCSISIHVSPRSVTGGDATFLFICFPGLSLLVSALFRWRCNISFRLSPRSVTGGVRPFPLFLFICLPCLSLLISALFRWPCSISIHLSPRLVTGGVRPFPLFLLICLPGLSLLVSALFRWPCSISIRLSPRSVTASVRPFPLAMQHFYS